MSTEASIKFERFSLYTPDGEEDGALIFEDEALEEIERLQSKLVASQARAEKLEAALREIRNMASMLHNGEGIVSVVYAALEGK